MKKKLGKKVLFVQDCGTLSDEFFVAIGCSYDEIIIGAKKLGAIKTFFDSMKDAKENGYEEHEKNDAGGVFFNNESNHVFLMRFKEWSDSWDFWEKLIHETHHVVQRLEKSKKIHNEDEFRAYTAEYIFHHIRRKLMGIEPNEGFHFTNKKK